jgi:hypothetical protein
MKNGFSFKKYPKFVLLVFTFILAIYLFKEMKYLPGYDILISYSFIGAFIAGIFFSSGLTAAPATAVLLILAKDQNLWYIGAVSVLGTFVGDLVIFEFFRYSFDEEIRLLSKEKLILLIDKIIPLSIRRHLLWILGAVFIASPLPDSIGIMIMASEKKVSLEKFSILMILLHAVGIFIILGIGKVI